MGFAMDKYEGFKQHGFTYEAMYAAAEGFTWPKLIGTAPTEAFSSKRAAAHWEGAFFNVSATAALTG